MSWDVGLFKFSRRYTDVSEMPRDEQPSPLGTLSVVQHAVTAVFPGTDWTEPSWGIFGSEFGCIEFNVGKDDPVTSVALHVRAGDAIVEGILLVCEKLDCQAIDYSDGSFLEQSAHPAQNLQKWRKYRDQIVAGEN